jgi:hypothetical protein
MLSNDTQMGEDTKARISNASNAYGCLQNSKPLGMRLNSRIKGWRVTVFTTVLYTELCENAECYPHTSSEMTHVDSIQMTHQVPFEY